MRIHRIKGSGSLSVAARSIKTPFQISVETGIQHIKLTCNQILRNLPGKRLVCSGEYDGQHVVIKFFLDPGRSKRHCMREERGISALKEMGINTPPLLFKGALNPGGEPVLVFQKIDPAIDFEKAWEQADSDTRHSDLLRQIVSVIADQHNAGLTQDDLHMGNFILSGNDIFTIDGAAVNVRHRGVPLSEVKSIKNLGLLFAQIYPRFDRLVPDAFMDYLKKRAWPENTILYHRLTKEIRAQRKKRKKKYLKKIYRESSDYICQKSWDHFWVYDRNCNTDNMARFLADPDALIDAGQLLKDGNSSTVALIEVDSKPMVVKRYNIKNAWHALRRCPRPSRAWISWRNAHRLNLLGISTPKPIAVLEKRWGPFRSKAYFITEYVDGIDVYHLLHSNRIKTVDYEGLVKQFGELLHQLANACISHGDFKATNFIFSDGKLIVIDLDAMREHRWAIQFHRKFKKDCDRLMKNWTDLPKIYKIFRDQLNKIEM